MISFLVLKTFLQRKIKKETRTLINKNEGD
jgi:hypothetical protein